MKLAGRIVFGILAVALAGLGFIFFAPGYSLYLVRSESMEPTINMGDLIISAPVGEKIDEGDVVTFKLGDELVTHRIYTMSETSIQTKGDAVEDVDPWTITSADVQGKYLFKIPYVGYVTRFVQTKVGWFVTIIVPAMILVIWLAKDIVKEALKTETKET
jgi:signal peptidase